MKKTSRKIMTLVLCGAGALLVPVAGAQEPAAAPATSGTAASQDNENHGGKHRWDANARLERLTKGLNLTLDQQAAIKPILEAEQAQMKAIRNDASVPMDQKKEKMKAAHEAATGQIKGILTPDQQAKYEELKKKFRGEKKEGGKQ